MGKRKGFLNPQSLFKFVRIGALVAPAVHAAVTFPQMEGKLRAGLRYYTGYDFIDGSWKWERLAQGWGPYLAAVLVTMGIPKLSGMIRRL